MPSTTDVPVLTIDGPGGSGKGTIAAQVASALGWHLLDSGALYRILAVVSERRQVPVEDEHGLVTLCQNLAVVFTEDGVLVDGADLSLAIRTEDAGTRASIVAAIPEVRQAILSMQRDFVRPPGLVADGRDMGTVVFPEARVKIFLDASAEARANRRYNQLKSKGLSVSLRGLLEQIQERDARDRERAVAPMKPANDAVIIDSTSLSIDEVFDQVMAEVASRG